jgi:hypothetical protein
VGVVELPLAEHEHLGEQKEERQQEHRGRRHAVGDGPKEDILFAGSDCLFLCFY